MGSYSLIKYTSLILCVGYFLYMIYEIIYCKKSRIKNIIVILILLTFLGISLIPFYVPGVGDSSNILLFLFVFSILVPIKSYKIIKIKNKVILMLLLLFMFFIIATNTFIFTMNHSTTNRFWYFDNYVQMYDALKEGHLIPSYIPEKLDVSFNDEKSQIQASFKNQGVMMFKPIKHADNVYEYYISLSNETEDYYTKHFRLNINSYHDDYNQGKSNDFFDTIDNKNIDDNGRIYYSRTQNLQNDSTPNNLMIVYSEISFRNDNMQYIMNFMAMNINADEEEYYRNYTRNEILKSYYSMFDEVN